MTGQMQARFKMLVAAFRDDTCGATAVLFGLMAVPLLGLGLAAFDYSRAHGVKASIESAADAAAVAGAKMLGAPHDQIEETVRGYLKTNLPAGRQELPFVLTFAPDDAALTLKLNTSVPTSILGIAGVSDMSVAVETTVERPTIVPIAPAPHRGVTPELPPRIANNRAANRAPTPEDMRQAEQQVRQLLEEIQRSGSSPDIDRVLRALNRRQ